LWKYKTIYGNYSICSEDYDNGDLITLGKPKTIWIGLALGEKEILIDENVNCLRLRNLFIFIRRIRRF